MLSWESARHRLVNFITCTYNSFYGYKVILQASQTSIPTKFYCKSLKQRNKLKSKEKENQRLVNVMVRSYRYSPSYILDTCWKEAKDSLTFIAANYVLSLSLLLSRERFLLPPVFQQYTRLQRLPSVYWTAKKRKNNWHKNKSKERVGSSWKCIWIVVDG